MNRGACFSLLGREFFFFFLIFIYLFILRRAPAFSTPSTTRARFSFKWNRINLACFPRLQNCKTAPTYKLTHTRAHRISTVQLRWVNVQLWIVKRREKKNKLKNKEVTKHTHLFTWPDCNTLTTYDAFMTSFWHFLLLIFSSFIRQEGSDVHVLTCFQRLSMH